jgi:hypothetical protein
MAPSRGILFVLTALLLSSLFLFALTYGRSRFGLHVSFGPPLSGSQNVYDSGAEDLLIGLHPVEHVLREPKVVNLRWNITRGYRSPDGVKKLVYLINGSIIDRWCQFC